MDADRATYEALSRALTAAFSPGTEETRRLAHSQLVTRRLKPGEDLDVYVRDLEKLLDKAYPGLADPLRSQQLVDQFLVGIPEAISHMLLINPPVDFTTTIARARELMLLEARRGKQFGRMEATAKAVVKDDAMSAVVRSLDTIVSLLEKLESRLDQGSAGSGRDASDGWHSKSASGRSEGDKTPFRGRCCQCKEIGHRRFECPKGNSPKPSAAKSTGTGKPVGVCTVGGLSDSWCVRAIIGGVERDCMVDTGATVSLISPEMLPERESVQPSDMQVKTVTGQKLCLAKLCLAKLSWKYQ